MTQRRTVVAKVTGRFGEIFVVDRGHRRSLRFGSPAGSEQSVVDRRAPDRLVSAYQQAFVLGALLAAPLVHALVIGLGGGGFVRFARRHLPRLRLEVVEIDAAVVRLARRHFGVRPGPMLAIRVGDAASHLASAVAAGGRYDLVVVDGYDGPSIPDGLRTPAFFRHLRRGLTRRGVAVMNLGLPDVRAENELAGALVRTFAGRCFELRNSSDDNRVAVASRAALPGKRELVSRARQADATGRLPFRLEPIARTYRAAPRGRQRPT